MAMERRGSSAGRRLSALSTSSMDGGASPMAKSSRVSIAPITMRRSSRPTSSFSGGRGGGGGGGGLGGGGLAGLQEPPLELAFETPSPTATRLRSLARSIRAVNSLGALKVRKRYLASAPMPAAGSVSQPIEQTAAVNQQALGPRGTSAATPMSARIIVLPTHEFSTAEMKFRLDPLEPTSPAAGWNVLDALTSNAQSSISSPTPTLVHRPSSAALTGGVAVAKNESSTNLAGSNTTSNAADRSSSPKKSRWKTANVKAVNNVHANGGPPTGNNSHNHDSTASSSSSGLSSLRRGQTNSAGSKPTKRNSTVSFASDPSYPSIAGGISLADESIRGSIIGSHIQLRVNVEARLCCARSLYKLSCQAGCELSIIRGGAISQLAEFSDIDHLHLHELCAATLANLTAAESTSAIDAFVANDGIPALLELSWSPSVTVKLLCATALCRLSSRSVHAAALARARASIEFMSMMSLSSEQLQKLAISCIVNLIFYGHSFPDRIFLGEPHAIQNQLGIMSITTQLALAPQTMAFAAEVLFNLALYRTSCSSVLRGGGADIIHGLAVHVCKALDDQLPSQHTGSSQSQPPQQQTPRLSPATAMALLRLIAHTLANFSVHSEFQSTTNGSTMKTLSLLLAGALRDLGSRFNSGHAEERLRILAAPCSRTLVNLSSSDEQRRHGFTPDMVQLTTRLFLLDRSRLFPPSSFSASSRFEEQSFARNSLRAIVNLSFHEPCTAQLMEFADVMPRLAKIVMGGDSAPGATDNADQGSGEKEKTGSEDEYEDDYDDEVERDAVEATHSNSSSATTTPDNPYVELTEGDGALMDSEMREDALVAIMNLAQQGAYAHELLKHIDGKRLARAADALARGSRLKYVYDVVLCNILFESRLQQLLYGGLVVNALIDGFYFFASRTGGTDGASANVDPFNTDCGSREALAFHHENLAFPDDQERFLVAIVTIAGEIMDPRNVDRLVALVLDCLRPMDMAMPPATRKWRRHITGYAAAILYTLARSSATRGDVGHRIHDTDTIQALIDICEGKPTAAATTASACDAMVVDVPDLATGRSTTITYCAFAQSFSAATLYHICATGHFTPRVIQALVSACNANEESLSLLACSAAFAIISFTSEGRQQLVASTQLARALNRLGRTSHVECQQYAAIAACNVSTLHCIWSSHELKDFIVVALLRANSLQAKQIHAKTLANLLSHITTRAKAVDDGVLYALMKLSQVMPPPTGVGTTTPEPAPSNSGAVVVVGSGSSQSPEPIVDEVFQLGLQVLFNLSCDHPYHSKLLGNGVVAFLATAILSDKQSSSSSTASNEPLGTGGLASSSSEISSPPLHATVSTESRRFAMGILCNLSSYETNHKELMHAQVIDILRSYVDDHDVETRASAAMAVRNLSCRQPWVEMICERRTLHMLINFTHCHHAVVRHFAMQALANCSQVTDSLHLFGELKVTRAVLSVLETIRPPGEAANARPPPSGKSKVQIPTSRFAQVDSQETSMAALKCLHNLAFDDALAENLMDESAILRLQPFMETRALDTCEEACTLVATMLSELAGKPRCANALLRQRVVAFCALLHRKHPHNTLIAYETCLVLVKLSTYQPIQAMLTETQAIAVVVAICTSPSATTDDRIRECGAIAIRNLALCVAEHDLVFDDDAGFEEDLAAAKIYKAKSRPAPPVADRSRGSGNSRGSYTRCDSSSSVSRLTERHLMQGVQYLQQEIERCLPVRRRRERVGPPTSTTTERILLEACACITNLSTVKSFRLEMVHAGVVSTLLHLLRASVPVPCMVHSMCSATLHRLALEEEATVDTHGLLVPSLLDILHQSDEELHQVRYECEKVSLPTLSASAARPQTPVPTARAASSSTAMGESMPSRVVAASTLNPGSTSSAAIDATSSATLLATTAYLKQTYREPKWITYVVKAMLSSASMVPQIEKKQIRAIGQPKLSFADLDSSSHFVVHTTTPPPPQQQPAAKSERGASVAVGGGPDEATATRKGGYLLPVHTDKFTAHLDACLRDGETSGDSAAGTGRSIDSIRQQQLSSSRSNMSARDVVATTSTGSSHDREAIVHSRKFDRHMRLTRRNHRRTKVLPVLSFM